MKGIWMRFIEPLPFLAYLFYKGTKSSKGTSSTETRPGFRLHTLQTNCTLLTPNLRTIRPPRTFRTLQTIRTTRTISSPIKLMKERSTLTHTEAGAILATIQAVLEEQQKGAAIAITDAHGELIAFLKTDGCPLPSIQNAINKAFTSAREGIPSKKLGDASRKELFPLTNFGDLRYIGWGGGMPLIKNGQIVGAVGVSGLPEIEDIALAQKGVAYFETHIA